MKNISIFVFLLAFFVNAQDQYNSASTQLSKLLTIESGLSIGGYGEVTYNNLEGTSTPAEIDVQRLVMLFAYKFDDRTSFVTEIEFEHVKEVYVEQAFVNYSVADGVNLRGGLMLVPMGIVNEYHEPTTFNGVERPSLDSKIVPSTWREMGLGVSGRVNSASLRYQAYLMNGFLSYGESHKLRGSDGLRKGRQKGAESVASDANFASRIEYYGLPKLKLGLSYYLGNTQTTNPEQSNTQVGLSMFGFDYRYVNGRFSSRGQLIAASLSDTQAYNLAGTTDLGSAMGGYYVEGAYNLLPLDRSQKLDLFLRYENFNTHQKTAGDLIANDAYHRKETAFGLSYHIANGAVFKMDYQSKSTAVDGSAAVGQLNMGLGVFF
ncbi:MAG: hypothetical protein VX094_01525 [Bacteroidota bacterium]|nr:hypothetical protein [Bacteroidota bacterium]